MQIEASHPYTTCGGPRFCDHCRRILTESPEQAHRRLTEENTVRGLRTNEALVFRTGVRPCTCIEEERMLQLPPDPYERGLAALRHAQGIELHAIADDDPRFTTMERFRDALRLQALTAALRVPRATSDVYANPPTPYSAEALAKHNAKWGGVA